MAERNLLWNDLRYIQSHHIAAGTPWVLLGDFNEILSSTEHSRHLDYVADQHGMSDFQSLVLDCGLQDMVYTGSQFTWWNHQDANPIGKKLDRVLINLDWLDTFSASHAEFFLTGFSDHARSVVYLTNDRLLKRQPFRFFNFLTENSQFLEIVSTVWNSAEGLFFSRSTLLKFHQKLKLLKPALRQLNRERYGNITTRTREAYDELCLIQEEVLASPTTDNFQAEREASVHWQHFADVEEKFFHQKSRINWLANGDMNTSFFHNSVKARTARNMIHSLVSRSGSLFTEHGDIAAEAVSYYQELLSLPLTLSSTPRLQVERILPFRCSPAIAAALVAPFQAEDIRKVIFSLPLNKAPGPDGFSAEFFRCAWPVIGSDLVMAIQSFFA